MMIPVVYMMNWDQICPKAWPDACTCIRIYAFRKWRHYFHFSRELSL